MLRSCTRKSGKVSQSFEIYVHPIELFLGKPPISSTRMIKALDENSNQPKIVNFRTAGIKEIRVKGYQSKVMQGKFCCESFWRNYRPAKQRHDPTIFTSMPKFLFIKRARFTWKAFATLKKGGLQLFLSHFLSPLRDLESVISVLIELFQLWNTNFSPLFSSTIKPTFSLSF